MPRGDLKTALITGASAGIGQALAHECALAGHDLVLVARDEARLQALAADLTGRHQVTVTVVSADLARPDGVDGLMQRLADARITVDLLINNAGYGVHGDFCSTSLTAELGLVEVQIGALLRLTKAILPGMLARGRGKILNVASVYSFSPVAFQAVYGATKSFMYSFTEALACELGDQGVSLTLLCPGATRTEFRQRSGVKEKKPGGSGMSAERVAAEGYRGLMSGKRLVVPGRHNQLFVAVARHIPASLVTPFLKAINKIRGVAPKDSAHAH